MTKLAKNPPKLFHLKGLLWTGAIIHLIATISVYLIGKLELVPLLIDSNGMLRGDAQGYLEKCQTLNQKISNWDFSFLITKSEQIHVRLFAPFFKVFSLIFGENVLAFEFVNIPVFLGILFLIYKIGESLFDSKTGLTAAFIVIFIPTFLLHTTQPLRDQFYILLFLSIVFFFLEVLEKKLQIKEFLFYLIGFAILFLTIWLVRDGAFLLYLSILVIVLFLLIIKNLKSLLSIRLNLLLVIILLAFVGFSPSLFSRILPMKAVTTYERFMVEKEYTLRQDTEKDELTARINVIRFRFNNTYAGQSGSDIDAGVFFDSWTQVLAYLPRALAIGFLAPFPNMWFEEGKLVGSVGRAIAGLETVFIYFVYTLAIIAIYYYSRSIKTWFLVSICLVGALSLGLVVVNIGTLYRTRYVLWLLVVILGSKGFMSLREKIGSTKSLGTTEN